MVTLQEYQEYHKNQIDKKQRLLIDTSHQLSTKDLRKLSFEIINHKKSIGFSKSGKMKSFYL